MVKKRKKIDPASKAFWEGIKLLESKPMFKALFDHARIVRAKNIQYPTGKWAMVTNNGDIYIHPKVRAKVARALRNAIPRQFPSMLAYSEAAALLSAIDEALDKGVWENDVAVNLEDARLLLYYHLSPAA